MNLTIDLAFISIAIARFNEYRWKRFLLKHIGTPAADHAIKRIKDIQDRIAAAQINGKTPKFLSFEFSTKI